MTDVGIRLLVTKEGMDNLRDVDRQLSGFARSAATIGKTLLGVGAGIYGLGSVTQMIDRTMTAMHDLASQAGRLKMTTEALGGMQYAAKMTGMEVGEFNSAIDWFNRTMGMAALGAKDSELALKGLGLQYKQLAGMSVAQQFALIADRLRGVSDAGEKAAIVTKLFGKGSIELMDMLDRGSAGLAALQAKFESLGGAVSRDQARIVEEAKAAVDNVGVAWKALKDQGTITLGPIIVLGAETALFILKLIRDESDELQRKGAMAGEAVYNHLNAKVGVIPPGPTADAEIKAYAEGLGKLRGDVNASVADMQRESAALWLINRGMAANREEAFKMMEVRKAARAEDKAAAAEQQSWANKALAKGWMSPIGAAPEIVPWEAVYEEPPRAKEMAREKREEANLAPTAEWIAAWESHEKLKRSIDDTVGAMQREAAAMSLVNKGLAENRQMADMMIATKDLPGAERIKALVDYGKALGDVKFIEAGQRIKAMQESADAMVASMEEQAKVTAMVDLGLARNAGEAQAAIQINKAYGEGTEKATAAIKAYGEALDTIIYSQQRSNVEMAKSPVMDTTRSDILESLQAERQFAGRFDVPRQYANMYQRYQKSAATDFGKGTTDYAAEMTKLDREIRGLRMAEMANQIGDAWGSAFEDMILGAKSAGEAIEALGMDIMRMVMRQTITDPMAQAISVGLQGMFSGGGGGGGGIKMADKATPYRMHAGGIVGYGYSGIPRLHGGLAADEFPAILQRGEVVLPKGGGGSGGAPSVTINIRNQSGTQVTADTEGVNWEPAMRQMTINAVVKELDGNSAFTNYIRSKVRGPI